jgi:hypothetical protein
MYHTETYIFHVNNYRMFITNMATVRKFELISENFNKVEIFASVDCAQLWSTDLDRPDSLFTIIARCAMLIQAFETRRLHTFFL